MPNDLIKVLQLIFSAIAIFLSILKFKKDKTKEVNTTNCKNTSKQVKGIVHDDHERKIIDKHMFPQARKKDLYWLRKIPKVNPIITKFQLQICYTKKTIGYSKGQFYFTPSWKKWEEKLILYTLTAMLSSPVIGIYLIKSIDFSSPQFSVIILLSFLLSVSSFFLCKSNWVRPYFTARRVETLLNN